MKLYPERLNRDFENTDENSKIQSAYERMLCIIWQWVWRKPMRKIKDFQKIKPIGFIKHQKLCLKNRSNHERIRWEDSECLCQ